ncbi:MAG: prepilin-type N-terminal cleavage/methylation domain-containing protein [Thermodesulfobacteriota bacterium]
MKNSGLTLIELVIVLALVSLLLVLSVTINSKFAQRRAIDRITYSISTALNTARLLASRNGVEFETDVVLNGDILSINTYRGTSNTGSVFGPRLDPSNAACQAEPRDINCPFSTIEIRVDDDYIVAIQGETDPINRTIQFNPGGTLGVAGTIIIRPDVANPEINKCGTIVLSSLGRIRTATGNWDDGLNQCNTIGDQQDEV